MDLQMLHLILNPVDNYSRITFDKDLLSSQLIFRTDNAHLSSMELHPRNKWVEEIRSPNNQQPDVQAPNDIARTTPIIPDTAVKVDLDKPQASRK